MRRQSKSAVALYAAAGLLLQRCQRARGHRGVPGYRIGHAGAEAKARGSRRGQAELTVRLRAEALGVGTQQGIEAHGLVFPASRAV